MNRISVRAARPGDAESIINAHYAAVHGVPAAFYPPEVIEAWSRKPDEARYKWIRDLIAEGDAMVIVGEHGSSVLGFGIVIPKLLELRALYVRPEASNQGVGQQILEALEAGSAARSMARIQLKASLNAVAFYRRRGYETLSRNTLRLSDEHEMDCMEMGKDL